MEILSLKWKNLRSFPYLIFDLRHFRYVRIRCVCESYELKQKLSGLVFTIILKSDEPDGIGVYSRPIPVMGGLGVPADN